MSRASMPARTIDAKQATPVTPISDAIILCQWHLTFNRGHCQICMAEEHEAQQHFAAHASEEEAH